VRVLLSTLVAAVLLALRNILELYFNGMERPLPKIFSISKISRFDVYGKPSEELQKTLRGLGAQIFDLFAGFSR
jgi:hypothetical protein